MLDIVLYIIAIPWWLPMSACDYQKIYTPRPYWPTHYVWKTLDDSGATEYPACIPPGAIVKKHHRFL